MELNMEPGAQIGVDGSMVQAPSTQIEVKNPSNLDGGGWSAAETLGESKIPAVGMGSTLGDLMIENCYKKDRYSADDGGTLTYDSSMPDGVAGTELKTMPTSVYDLTSQHEKSEYNDASCPMADNALNMCYNIIDAAQYIGVTFDVRKGYNAEGFRDQIVVLWCSNGKTFANNRFDVPDFMHVQGVYETTMYTKAHNTIEDYLSIKSEESNSRTGSASFAEDASSLKSMKSSYDSNELSGGVSASKNGNSAGIEASRKTDGGTGDGSS